MLWNIALLDLSLYFSNYYMPKDIETSEKTANELLAEFLEKENISLNLGQPTIEYLSSGGVIVRPNVFAAFQSKK